MRDSEVLDAPAKLVAHTLSTYMDKEGLAWPAKATLASKCALSARTIDRAVDRLEHQGFVRVTRANGYRRGGNKYRAVNPNSVTETYSPHRNGRRPAAPTRETSKAQNSGVADSPVEAAARWLKNNRDKSPERINDTLDGHWGVTAAECEAFLVTQQVAV